MNCVAWGMALRFGFVRFGTWEPRTEFESLAFFLETKQANADNEGGMEHDDDDGEDVLDDEERAEAEGEEGEVCHKGTDPTMSKLKTGRGDDVRRRLMHLFVCSTIYMNEVLMVTLLFWFSLLFNFLPLDSEEKKSGFGYAHSLPQRPKGCDRHWNEVQLCYGHKMHKLLLSLAVRRLSPRMCDIDRRRVGCRPAELCLVAGGLLKESVALLPPGQCVCV